jgi:hypothetical protein
LFVGTVADFSGMDPLIYREPLRTEQYDATNLNGKSIQKSISSSPPPMTFSPPRAKCQRCVCQLAFTGIGIDSFQKFMNRIAGPVYFPTPDGAISSGMCRVVSSCRFTMMAVA